MATGAARGAPKSMPAGPARHGRALAFRPALGYKRAFPDREPILAYGYAPASPSLADPTGSSALVAAVQWVQGTLLGTAATSVAVISVAAVGLMMLSGRIDLRRGASVIIGCFILFGASSIAAGIRSVADGGPAGVPAETYEAWTPPPQPPLAAPPPASDPYAGAAVPTRWAPLSPRRPRPGASDRGGPPVPARRGRRFRRHGGRR